jgi:hypothetical protein
MTCTGIGIGIGRGIGGPKVPFEKQHRKCILEFNYRLEIYVERLSLEAVVNP